ncbi:hypothetical protein ACFOKI_12680 [Sphingomonas qilianensis]|uniref:FitA-like ribbon-helix-helix domain-containing protein n=1 Tax=Sphingomonas qilianensis TaxID=1736690 RepID=UPI00360A0A25
MGQILVRQLDDATITRLEIAARERNTSVEALARAAIQAAATLTADEKSRWSVECRRSPNARPCRGFGKRPAWI